MSARVLAVGVSVFFVLSGGCATIAPSPQTAGFADSSRDCDRGDANACQEAALAIIRGTEGAPADMDLARRLLVRACDDLHSAGACVSLAGEYRSGTFPDSESQPLAERYAVKACGLSGGSECGYYGAIVFFGDGTTADRERGRGLIERACEHGNLSSCVELRTLLLKSEIDVRNGNDAATYHDKVCPPGFDDVCSCSSALDDLRRPAKKIGAPTKTRLVVNERLVIHGYLDQAMHLPTAVVEDLAQHGVNEVIVSIEFCVTAQGALQCLQPYQRSPYPAVEDWVLRRVKTWTFEPYQVNGQGVPVCSKYAYRYVIR